MLDPSLFFFLFKNFLFEMQRERHKNSSSTHCFIYACNRPGWVRLKPGGWRSVRLPMWISETLVHKQSPAVLPECSLAGSWNHKQRGCKLRSSEKGCRHLKQYHEYQLPHQTPNLFFSQLNQSLNKLLWINECVENLNYWLHCSNPQKRHSFLLQMSLSICKNLWTHKVVCAKNNLKRPLCSNK